MKRKISAPLSIPIAARTVRSAATEVLRYCRRRGEYQDLLSAIWRDAASEGRWRDVDDLFDIILRTDVTIGICHTPELGPLFERHRKTTAHPKQMIFLSELAEGGVDVIDLETACDECTHVIFAIDMIAYFQGRTAKARDNAIRLERQFYCVYFRDIPTYFIIPSGESNGVRIKPRVQSILDMHERKWPPANIERYDGSSLDARIAFLNMCLSITMEKDRLIKELVRLRQREWNERTESNRKKVFIGYSHNDAEWVKRIRTHLKAIGHLGRQDIQIWDDTRISPSERWYEVIMQSIDAARVAVLLISADFFASDFIMEHEWPRIRAARDSTGLEIVPVIIGPSAFTELPDFKDIQAVNDPKRPVASLALPEADGVFDKVRQVVEAKLLRQ